MWGGIKSRKDYSQHFSRWVPTKGLEGIRKALAHEPRPWYLAFGLHQQNNLLQDHHCARLISWCTTIVQLHRTSSGKKEVYRYAHETFHLLNHSHKPGKESFLEFMRLCAVGKDLTSAFEWHQHWIETKKKGHDSLLHLVWLLRIAALGPSDEGAEDMASAVLEGYSLHFCTPMENGESGERRLAHFEPQSPEEEQQLRGLFLSFKALRPRVQERGLLDFIDSLPVEGGEGEVRAWLDDGWPSKSHHHVLPHLEGGQSAPRVSLEEPRLRDSILNPALIRRLEEAAFAHDVRAVVGLLGDYQRRLSEEKEAALAGKARSSCLRKGKEGGEEEVWRQFADASARQFRAPVVEGGGLTPELYHYLVVALARTHPTAALRTLGRMRDANLRVLDLTRAVVLAAAAGDFDAQLALFNEQLAAVAARAKLDEDFDLSKPVEHYWKYEYTELFAALNGLDLASFYGLLLRAGRGPGLLQALLLASGLHGVEAADLVVVDAALRESAAAYFRAQAGPRELQAALDAIPRAMPRLDLALVGALPHFADYALPAADGIATDAAGLQSRLFAREGAAVGAAYVLDASFVETGEGFLNLGLPPAREAGSLILIPYVALAQLGASIAKGAEVVSFDAVLQEAIQGEPFLASQRLRALRALLEGPTAGSVGRRVRLLHFTECLQAHGMLEKGALAELGLDPAASDNDHVILVLAMLAALAPPGMRIVLCTDDRAMRETLERVSPRLFARAVEVLSTEPPETVVDLDKGIINDTPAIDFHLENFTPKCGKTNTRDAAKSLSKSPPDDSASSAEGGLEGVRDRKVVDLAASRVNPFTARPEGAEDVKAAHLSDSPWLSMLQDLSEDPQALSLSTSEHDVQTEAASSKQTELASAPKASLTTPLDGNEAKGAVQPYEALMNLYASPSDIVPIGVKVQEADALGSIFEQFDVMEPDTQALMEEETKARKSRLTTTGGGGNESGKRQRQRRRSALEREALNSRGASNKEKYHLARQLSNMSGGRVPFNFRYRIVEANILDPRNAPLRKSYEDAMRKKRAAFKRNRL